MLSYITILITAALGILGLVTKSKKSGNDDESRSINKLTPFGIAILVLLILTLCINLYTNIKKDHDTEIAALDAINQEKRDSVNARNNYITDSLRYEITISNLKNQSRLQIDQIEKDSIRYVSTMSNLAQQLTNQRKTIEDIRLMMHPLFPMKMTFTFEMDISSLSESNGQLLDKLFNNWFDNPVKSHPVFFQPHDYRSHRVIASGWHDVSPSSDTNLVQNYTKTISDIDLFMQKFIPDINLEIKKNPSSTSEASVLILQNSTKLPHSIHYTIDERKKTIKFGLTYQAKPGADNQGNISSMLECNNGNIILYVYSDIGMSHLALKEFKFNCGSSFQEKYVFTVTENERQKSNSGKNIKVYQKRINI